jgi:ATP-dependent Clp protease ATP-binding subunit ClpA
MFERFTTPARRAVEAAVAEALKSRSDRVRPEHLFVALLLEPEGRAAQVLADLGAPTEALLVDLAGRRGSAAGGLGLDEEDVAALATIGIDLDEVLARIGDEPEPRQGRRHVRFSREAKKVLELSLREAIALRHNRIGTEHLLLGVVRVGDPLVTGVLAAFEVTPAVLRGAVADAARRAG